MNAPSPASAAIGRVVRAAATRAAAPEWAAMATRIADERAAVERFIAEGGRAYGFSTRLGHLDAVDADAAAVAGFIDDHRWGTPVGLDVDVLRLMDAVKLEQLGHGGSGMSPATAAAIIRHLETREAGEASGAWLVSYGAGDVIPATWWLADVLATTGVDAEAGDFIAAVNGHFFSTAAGIIALVDAARLLAAVIARLPGPALPLICEDGALAALAGVVAPAPAPPAGTQAPISLRDSAPTIRAVAATVDDVTRAIGARLADASANPRFVLDDGVRAVSANGYLDPDLSFALGRLGATARLAIDHVQRLVEHAASAGEDPRLVQAPKAVAAIAERAAMVDIPAPHGAAHSRGVEDLADGSLLAASAVLAISARLREALAVADAAGVAVMRDGVEAALLAPVGLDAAQASVVAGWADALRRIP